jgi:hypothetical protein
LQCTPDKTVNNFCVVVDATNVNKNGVNDFLDYCEWRMSSNVADAPRRMIQVALFQLKFAILEYQSEGLA